MPREFRILVATDGSRPARAALAAAARFPWPEPSRSRGVVALGEMGGVLPSLVRAAAVRALYAHARHAERVLRARWPDAISVGWRGHGSYDGSPQARRALELLARLRFAPGVRPALLLVSVVPPLVEGARRDSALGKGAICRLAVAGARAVLGSVAAGVLDRSAVPVLIVP